MRNRKLNVGGLRAFPEYYSYRFTLSRTLSFEDCVSPSSYFPNRLPSLAFSPTLEDFPLLSSMLRSWPRHIYTTFPPRTRTSSGLKTSLSTPAFHSRPPPSRYFLSLPSNLRFQSIIPRCSFLCVRKRDPFTRILLIVVLMSACPA